MKKFAAFLTAILALAGCGKPQTVAIVSINDMHGNIETMGQIATIVDSIKALYPKTLVLSAGDNRTGFPASDMYPESSWPMTCLMNMVGFDASAFGNHEFDGTLESFVLQASKSTFKYICSNVSIPGHEDLIADKVIYDFDGQGPRIAIFGVVQVDEIKGYPDMSPTYAAGGSFTPELEVIPNYAYLAKENDAVIMLNHVGFDEDVELAEGPASFVDLIVGGHSHTLIEGAEEHGGVWITQCERRSKYLTITKLDFKGNKLKTITSELVNLKEYKSNRPDVDAVVDEYVNNEALEREVGTLARPYPTKEEVGIFMGEALRNELGTQIALLNNGSVRTYEFPAGPLTVNDLLTLDPFGNEGIVYTFTGEQVREIIKRCYLADYEYGPGYVSGISYKIVINKDDPTDVKEINIFMPDGTPIKDDENYTMATSNFVASITDADEFFEGANSGYTTVSTIESFLKKNTPLNLKDKQNVTVVYE